jgi:hypothetical protein
VEPTTIGLSEHGHRLLRSLEEEKHFPRMLDAYRFAVALALAHGASSAVLEGRRTIFNVGTFDPDGTFYDVVAALRSPDESEPVYQTVERLAEWGVNELVGLASGGDLRFGELLTEAEALANQPVDRGGGS